MSKFDKHAARLHEALETQILKREKFYPGLLDYLTSRNYFEGNSKILCATTGHGTLYSILLKEGYDVYGNDGSPEMVSRLENKIKRMGLKHKHEPTNYQWQELAQHYPEEFFDFIFTEGNSLIYAGSWAKEEPDLSKSMEELEDSILNKAKILRKNGIWYVDIPKDEEEETPHEGKGLLVDGRIIDLYCKFHNDWDERVRTFTMKEDDNRGNELLIVQKAPLITGKELEEMTVPKYFSAIFKCSIDDPHYQGYILRK